MTIDEMIAVMQASKEGAVIQCRRTGDTKWETAQGPVWNWLSYVYRVKPEPREWYAVLDCDGFGDVYPDKATAERDAATYNERVREYAPYRVAHLREVA